MELCKKFIDFGEPHFFSDEGENLCSGISSKLVDDRSVLVGDAAHALHPLAGQGMNLGLSDVASLNSKVVKARRAGLDIGSNSVLKRYERSRKIPNLTMTTLMELFKKGFESSDPWARLFRNLAFQNVSRNKILKRKFIKEAAGIT